MIVLSRYKIVLFLLLLLMKYVWTRKEGIIKSFDRWEALIIGIVCAVR